LVKKPEEQQDIIIPTAAPTQPSKPEVYFIKYKTQKEQGGASFGGSSAGGSSFGGSSSGGSSFGGSSSGGSSFGGSDLGSIGGGQDFSTGSGISAGGADFGGAPANPQSSYGPPSKY
jgi:Domain of unknown function (DUF243)